MNGTNESAGQAGADGGAAPSAGDVPADAGEKTVAAVLGEIVWLMSQDPAQKGLTFGDLEWMVMPAILLRQFRLFYKEGRPVAAVLYARVSEEVEVRLKAGDVRLTPTEWASGERVVLMRRIGAFGLSEELLSNQRTI